MTSSTENSVQSSQIEHLLKIIDVMEIIGRARTKIYELVKDGVLPKPIYITPTMPRWQPKTVNQAIAQLAENSKK